MTTPEQEKKLPVPTGISWAIVIELERDIPGWYEMRQSDMNHIQRIIEAALVKALLQAKQEEMEQCCKDIRDACGPCSGTGHASIDCECEYCGRPIRAIRSRSEGES